VKRDGVFRDHPDRPLAPSPPREASDTLARGTEGSNHSRSASESCPGGEREYDQRRAHASLSRLAPPASGRSGRAVLVGDANSSMDSDPRFRVSYAAAGGHTQPRWWPPDVLPALSVQMPGEVLANFELIRAQPSPTWTSGDATRRFSRVLLLREASSIPVTQRASSRERAIRGISDRIAR
jgi:hypothetical protein